MKKARLKWQFFTETGFAGSGKNPKSEFFLLGLKYTLRTCFDSKKFLSKSCPELKISFETIFSVSFNMEIKNLSKSKGLPLPAKPVSVKNGHLTCFYCNQQSMLQFGI
jgi:hypothetical protein